MPVVLNDISEHQGAVNWAAHRAGRQAVILRAHNGNRRDSRFAANRSGARPLRLVGIYQYLVADRDPTAQAREFVATVGRLAANEWPVLDIEEGDRFSTRARAWLAVVEPALGRRAWVYSGDANWQATDLRQSAGDRPRWVARYASTAPRTTPWHVWQRSSTARAPGVVGNVDESVYPGTLDQLVALALGGASTNPQEDDVALSADDKRWLTSILLGRESAPNAKGDAPVANLADLMVRVMATGLTGAGNKITRGWPAGSPSGSMPVAAQLRALVPVITTAVTTAVGTALGGLDPDRLAEAADEAVDRITSTLDGLTATTTVHVDGADATEPAP